MRALSPAGSLRLQPDELDPRLGAGEVENRDPAEVVVARAVGAQGGAARVEEEDALLLLVAPVGGREGYGVDRPAEPPPQEVGERLLAELQAARRVDYDGFSGLATLNVSPSARPPDWIVSIGGVSPVGGT